jgi:dTDP-glucose 4,6-dehydratase
MTKRVMITGGAGFIGHHLIDKFLKSTDWEIISLDRLDYSGNLNRLSSVISEYPPEVQQRVRIVWHDLKAEISDLSRNFTGDVDIIIHLAASSHVDRSITHPMEFLMDNTAGTVNILNFARQQKNLERFIYFSTDEIFGIAPNGTSYKERDRYNSTNPYSASKAAAEEFCVAFENTYKLPIYITHTMNVFGQRQHPEKYIPMCIRKVHRGETIQIHANAEKTIPGSRFYIHASDVADAMLFLLTLPEDKKKLVVTPDITGAKCPKFNVVGKEEIDNLQLASWIAYAQNKELKYELIDFHTSRPGHDLRYALDGSYMESLGWVPSVSIQERITQVVRWSLEHMEWVNI